MNPPKIRAAQSCSLTLKHEFKGWCTYTVFHKYFDSFVNYSVLFIEFHDLSRKAQTTVFKMTTFIISKYHARYMTLSLSITVAIIMDLHNLYIL